MVNLMKKILFLLLLLFIFPLSVFSYDFNINSNNVIFINLNEDKISKRPKKIVILKHILLHLLK